MEDIEMNDLADMNDAATQTEEANMTMPETAPDEMSPTTEATADIPDAAAAAETATAPTLPPAAELIRRDLIDAAAVKVTEAVARQKVAADAYAVAAEKHAAATAAHADYLAKAAEGGDTARPVELERAVAEAAGNRAHFSALCAAADRGVSAARKGYTEAVKAAHLPLMQAAACERIAAAQDFADAMALLTAAVQRSAAATPLIYQAKDAGVVLAFDGGWLAPDVHHHIATAPMAFRQSLRTPEAEAALWQGVL